MLRIRFICGTQAFHKLRAKLEAIDKRTDKMFQEELDLKKLKELREKRRQFFRIPVTPRVTPRTAEETMIAKVSILICNRAYLIDNKREANTGGPHPP